MNPDRYQITSLLRPKALIALAAIGAGVACVAACFAYAGGFLSPGELTQGRMIDDFQQANGIHDGFRRNHAKGVCISGHFEGSNEAAKLSKATVFSEPRVPVYGRFALAGGMPYMPDNGKAVRSMALDFRPAHGEEWRTGMNDIPVFPVKDATAFAAQLIASVPDPATGKPAPAKMAEFLKSNPESAKAISLIGASQFSSGFANATFNSLNAFKFVNSSGSIAAVRWSMVAQDPFVAEPSAPPPDKNYLFDAVAERLRTSPIIWILTATVAQPGDPTSDATLPWPSDRERVAMGTLTIDHIESEQAGNCRDINFDPLVLPAGIEPSDDPLLSARSAAYSQSFFRRASESKSPSAVQINDAGK